MLPSSLHQCLKFPHNNDIVVVLAEPETVHVHAGVLRLFPSIEVYVAGEKELLIYK